MSVFTQEFVGATKAADASVQAAMPGGQFATLNFRRREFTEFADGEYRIQYADGRTAFIKARSALEAMEQALQHGPVHKVLRSTIKRVRLIESENVRDLDPNLVAGALIKPGAILVSFATMTKVVHQKDHEMDLPPAPLAAEPQPAAEVVAPAYEAPAAPLEEPVAEAVIEAAPESVVEEAAAAQLASDERPLTPEEVEELLHSQNPKAE